MMVSMETVLLRGKRNLEQWTDRPWFRLLGKAGLYGGSGFLLSGISLWGSMQPIAAALAVGCRGWWCLWAAVGSGIGYRWFWGDLGIQGLMWTLGGLLAGLLLPFFPERRRVHLAAAGGGMVGIVGLAWSFGNGAAMRMLLFQVGVGALCCVVSDRVLEGRDRVSQWTAAGLLVMGLCRIGPNWCNPGFAAAGALAAAAPLPAAALAGIGGDLAGRTSLPLTAVVCLTWFFQLLPMRETRRRMFSPGAACLGVMLLTRQWDWQTGLCISFGGVLGAMIPWQLTAVPRHGGVGAAQVQLEQNARVLLTFQRQLLEYPLPPLDERAVVEQVKENACAACSFRIGCPDITSVNLEVLQGAGFLPCQRANNLAFYLNQGREQLKRMKAVRALQEEYRAALVQQYGFLADVLHRTADRLPEREYQSAPHYRVQVSSRSRGRGLAEGDRVTAFPGRNCRYYVILCDGMGTGMGAAEEGRQAAVLLRRMLLAGLPPVSALGSINTQLTILGRGGAVTVDLAEIRVDNGTAWLYKWGANPSWLFSGGKAEKIGYATPPPGLDVRRGGETANRAPLSSGQVLVMVSDGVNPQKAPQWAKAAQTTEPGKLAQQILEEGGSREDDATAVVIRLVEKTSEP